MSKVGHIQGDLANTNIGHVGGIAAILSQKAGRVIAAAPCDLHIMNRALQNALEWAYGPYQVGDVHVLAVAYSIAATLDADWQDYAAQLHKMEDERAGGVTHVITKCPLPVTTRWWTVVLCITWILEHRDALITMAEAIHFTFPSSQTGLR